MLPRRPRHFQASPDGDFKWAFKVGVGSPIGDLANALEFSVKAILFFLFERSTYNKLLFAQIFLGGEGDTSKHVGCGGCGDVHGVLLGIII